MPSPPTLTEMHLSTKYGADTIQWNALCETKLSRASPELWPYWPDLSGESVERLTT